MASFLTPATSLVDGCYHAAVDAKFAVPADAVGLPVDQLKLLVSLLLACPLAAVYRVIPNSLVSLKHACSIAGGIALCIFCLGPFSWMHAFVSSFVCYALMRFAPHGVAHRLVFIFAMAYMSASHIYRMYVEWLGWRLDFTGPQMLLTIKLTSLAINYFDGNRSAKEQEKFNEHQQRYSVSKLPSLLEFYGYVYYFPSFLAGPSMEYKDYIAFADGSMFKEFGGKAPGSFVPFLQALGKALLVAPFVYCQMKILPASYLTTAAYMNAPFYERAIRIYAHFFHVRFKYYFGWYLSETAFIVSGLSYNGKDENGKLKWDRVTNSGPIKVELAQNAHEMSENWNICTSRWLKNYVYNRFEPGPGGKHNSALPTVATYATSAFWHGFYPGYYMFFFSAALLTETSKWMRRKVRPYFLRPDGTPIQPYKLMYDIVGMIVFAWCVSYAGYGFVLLVPGPAIAVWRSVYYLGHILPLTAYVLLVYVLPTPRRASSSSSAGNRAAAETDRRRASGDKTKAHAN